MKVAINAIPLLSPLTGIGKYTYEITKQLGNLYPDNEYSYFYGYFSRHLRGRGEFSDTQYHLKEKIKQSSKLRHFVRTMIGFSSCLSAKKHDVYFEPNFIPLKIRAQKTVVTVADFSFREHPEWHPKDRADYFSKVFWKKIEMADRIIVISDYIKTCAVQYGLPEEKLRTIHLGYDRGIFRCRDKELLQKTRLKYNLPDKFVLFVGSIEPRKNLHRLLKAYLSLDVRLRTSYKLVLVGFKGWDNRVVMDLLKQFEQDVIYTGYVSEQELGEIYNLATLFVYPSLYEGFGLPPLEAMACGCPVLTSPVTSLPEVCGDAASYADPEDEKSIAKELTRLLEDESARKELSRKGIERARQFSWERSAREHMEVFRGA
jgi:glycosyltransferase involved in cell wall biosynthesis